MKRCKDCKWYDNSRSNPAYGDCRKKSPVVLVDGYEIGCAGHTTVWPETAATDWCGEFEAKKEGIENE